MNGGSASTDPMYDLRELVRRHRVYWLVWPEHELGPSDQVVNVGFRLALMGTHDHPATPPIAGCIECQRVYADLASIARALLPGDVRQSDYHVSHFEGSLSYAGGERKDVIVTIRITARFGVAQPAGPCQSLCLEEMVARLKTLGAPQGQWREESWR